jgi:NAD(P)H-hydrate repair Nnr-like enzyme with NAD(P)H-hydrate dehydratase domain
MNNYWLKQTISKPLFEDLIWSQPENKRHAGKLLIVGGNSQGFSTPVLAYSQTLKAGAGVVHVLMPSSTEKMVGHFSSDVSFSPSTKSGGFSRESLGTLVEAADWSDGVFLAGEIGSNSESVVLIESFIEKYNGPLIIANDAVHITTLFIEKTLQRPETVIVTDIGMLQKLTSKIMLPSTIKHSISMVNLVESLHELTTQTKISLVIKHEGSVYISSEGKVSTTPISDNNNWELLLSSHAAVWVIQNPNKIFEALSCAVISSNQ